MDSLLYVVSEGVAGYNWSQSHYGFSSIEFANIIDCTDSMVSIPLWILFYIPSNFQIQILLKQGLNPTMDSLLFLAADFPVCDFSFTVSIPLWILFYILKLVLWNIENPRKVSIPLWILFYLKLVLWQLKIPERDVSIPLWILFYNGAVLFRVWNRSQSHYGFSSMSGADLKNSRLQSVVSIPLWILFYEKNWKKSFWLLVSIPLWILFYKWPYILE